MNGNIPNRRNWSKPLTIITLTAFVAVIVGYFADSGAEIKDRLYFQNNGGPVLFDHNMHSQAADSCATCHHELLSAEQAIPCSECHDDDMDAGDFSYSELQEIHEQDCSRCHQQKSDKEPDLSCRECHAKAQPEKSDPSNCQKCHDDDYTADMIAHDEYLEVEDHSCLGCHTPGTISEIYHQTCTQCHMETAPERFANADGGVLCGACHLR